MYDCALEAIDGKTVRHSFDHGDPGNSIHLISAWADGCGLSLGQLLVDPLQLAREPLLFAAQRLIGRAARRERAFSPGWIRAVRVPSKQKE
mgnify:CR=1 FL=1